MSAGGDERIKARAVGVVMALGGIGALVYLATGGPFPHKVFVLLATTGPTCIWFGGGLAVVPVPESVFQQLEQGADLGKWFGGLPRFWKVWRP
jgi:hypothetical protein